MTRQIKQDLDAELPDGHVPITFDTDGAIAKGKRTAKRRTMYAAAGGMMSVIAIVALAATILTPPPEQNKPAGESSQSAEPEPPVELNPDQEYRWGTVDGSNPTQDTVPYHEAFREHMDAQFPDAEIMSIEETVTPLSQASDNAATFVREETNLSEVYGDPKEHEFGETVFERDVFALTQDYSDGNPHESLESGPLSISFDGKGDFQDDLSVLAVPAGTFALDTGDAIDLAACNNDSAHTELDSCEAEAASGPNGETMREVTMKLKDEGEPAVESGRAAVLQRDDGSGVVVSDETLRLSQDEPGPSLDFEQLSDIALALPESPIK